MELRAYWRILRRRWWLPAILTGLVALFSLIQLQPWQQPPPTYTATVRVLVGVLPLDNADSKAYDPRYYAWLTSEYLVDDFTEVVKGNLFAQAVSARLDHESLQIPPNIIQGSADTGRRHRILTLNLSWPNRDQLVAIAQAATDELTENASTYFRQLGNNTAFATLLDGPYVSPTGPSLRSRLEFPLRVVLAVLIGVGLVFLWEYLDDSIRERQDLESMGLAILAEIPRHR